MKTTQIQDSDVVIAFKNLKDRVQSGIQKYRGRSRHVRPQPHPMINDFSRLARRLRAKSVGVVLGGGGAHGISHLVSDISMHLSSSADKMTGRLACARGAWYSH